jgi:hypothetical protein
MGFLGFCINLLIAQLFRATPAGEISFGAKRRTRSAGGGASPPARSIEELRDELEQIRQFVLLYPAQGAGPYRAATVVSTQSLMQKGLADILGWQQFGSTPRG